jgi:hypothetical protein
VQVLSTGYIFVYFQNISFGRRFARTIAQRMAWGMAAYSLLAFIFLFLSHSGSKYLGLFLAGAAAGWIGEGIVVQTAYEILPLSISLYRTGMACSPYRVRVGWYAVRKSLVSPDQCQH